MPIWEFTLIIEGVDAQGGETLGALFEAGCDDALVGRTNDIQHIDFSREARSLADAVLSAVSDVESVSGSQLFGSKMAIWSRWLRSRSGLAAHAKACVSSSLASAVPAAFRRP